MIDELVAALRGLIQHGVLQRVDDSGSVQMVDVQTAEGVLRSSAEVLQMPGFASRPGTGGVVALVLAPGGDQGIPLVIVRATGAGLGNLGEGESAVYALDGSARVHCKPGGEVHVLGAQKVIAETVEAEITATSKATVTAPQIELHGTVNVVGTLKVNGTVMNVP